MPDTSRPRSKALVLAVLAGALPACGHKGNPLPPLRHTPPPLTEFRFAQRGSSLEISVTAPGASVDGIGYESVAVEFLYVEGPKDIEKTGVHRPLLAHPRERVAFSLPLPAAGTIARAAARGVYEKQRGPRTLIMGLVAQAEVQPPRELEATLTADGIRLAWTGDAPAPVDATIPPPKLPGFAAPRAPGSAGLDPVGTKATGAQPTGTPAEPAKPEKIEKHGGFYLYRRSETGTYAAPLTPRLLEKHALTDTSAPEGQKVCYVVRAAASIEPLVESGPSNEACVGVKDIKPPAPPTGLAVLPREGGLELVWTPSPEEDLAGYRVYREAAGEPRARVAEIDAAHAGWTDATAKPGVAYSFTVTAFDRAGNESGPTAPLQATLP
jgi:predicted small lipoprotein YifL